MKNKYLIIVGLILVLGASISKAQNYNTNEYAFEQNIKPGHGENIIGYDAIWTEALSCSGSKWQSDKDFIVSDIDKDQRVTPIKNDLLGTNPELNGDFFIHTVNGPVKADELGFALTHEHIMSNFGAEREDAGYYDENALFNQVIPYLKKLKSMGVNAIFECTTAHFGRRVDLLKTIADSTGLQIITNTGFYGGANDKYIPESSFSATAEQISLEWIGEFETGINDTGIKPGFIKLGFDDGSPSDLDIKLFEAGILTHLSTGLTLAVHTGNNPEAVEAQIKLLEDYRVGLDAWIWVHAEKSADVNALINLASKGAWISLDGVNELNIQEIIEKLNKFKSEGLLDKVLLSHDGNSFRRGGAFKPFESVSQDLIPAMQNNGFTTKEINQLMVENPKKAFQIKSRRDV